MKLIMTLYVLYQCENIKLEYVVLWHCGKINNSKYKFDCIRSK